MTFVRLSRFCCKKWMFSGLAQALLWCWRNEEWGQIIVYYFLILILESPFVAVKWRFLLHKIQCYTHLNDASSLKIIKTTHSRKHWRQTWRAINRHFYEVFIKCSLRDIQYRNNFNLTGDIGFKICVEAEPWWWQKLKDHKLSSTHGSLRFGVTGCERANTWRQWIISPSNKIKIGQALLAWKAAKV